MRMGASDAVAMAATGKEGLGDAVTPAALKRGKKKGKGSRMPPKKGKGKGAPPRQPSALHQPDSDDSSSVESSSDSERGPVPATQAVRRGGPMSASAPSQPSAPHQPDGGSASVESGSDSGSDPALVVHAVRAGGPMSAPVARAVRTDGPTSTVNALLQQLRQEPANAAECAAKFQ